MNDLGRKVREALALGAALQKAEAEALAQAPEASTGEQSEAFLLAEDILAQVPDMAKLAAEQKKPVVVVMRDLADGHDFNKPKGWNDFSTCLPEWLIEGGVAQRVFAELKEAGLSPSIPKEFEYDLDIGEGFYIVIPTDQALAQSGAQPAVPPAPQDSGKVVSAPVRIYVFRMTARSGNALVTDRTWCQLSLDNFGYEVGKRGSDDFGGPEPQPDRELIGYLDAVAAAGELEELLNDPGAQLDIGN